MSRKKTKLVCGVGINDADYSITRHEIVDGKDKIVWTCPFYVRWREMLRRCYSSVLKERAPTYKSCTVEPTWLKFSVFKAWMETQDWEGKQLDKDLLVRGNKHYSPDTCLFLDQKVNKFITDSKAARGDQPIGVTFHKSIGKYVAECNLGKSGNSKYLGYFNDAEEAHAAWLEFKIKQAHILASEQTDERVAIAIIKYYENYHEAKEK